MASKHPKRPASIRVTSEPHKTTEDDQRCSKRRKSGTETKINALPFKDVSKVLLPKPQERSQEELKQIYGKGKLNIKLPHDSEESDESEDEEIMNIDDFEETEGYKTLIQCLNEKYPVKS